MTEKTWLKAVRERLEMMPWESVVTDVVPFLEPQADPEILSRHVVMGLIERRESLV